MPCVSPVDELDELLQDNRKVMLQSIAAELRARLPLDAMLPSETTAQHKVLNNMQVPVATGLYFIFGLGLSHTCVHETQPGSHRCDV